MPRVRGHFRNGSWVRSHYRRPPRNAGLGGMALAVAVLAVIGTLGGSGGPPTPSTTTLPTEPSPRTAPLPGRRHYIVQVASAVQRTQAESVAKGLVRHGWHNVGVLRSSAYEGLRPGYWVAYIGPFQASSGGRRQAEGVRQQLPGTRVRLIR
jgi:hypothetical protein